MRTTQGTSPKTYSRSIDYLGALGKTLRDLAGYASLAYELVQNAEDAGATWVAIRIRPDALVVDNDGAFTDCGDLDAPECPWTASDGHRCDFHRFRIVAGADKRNEEGTVGAFGIGFTAVYQITDQPHLISAGRHWIVDETRDEQNRILECPGCPECHAEHLPGTRIRLPWATDGESELRRRLQAEPVPTAVREELERELLLSLPTAMLFLRKVGRIDVERPTRGVERIERVAEEGRVLLATSTGTTIWNIVRGEFAAEGESLRDKHGGRIEAKRGTEVVVAVPETLDVPGHLCAFLPTQHQTGLPFHVQADFFPTSDRKRVILDAGYQAEWNEAAIHAAARALAEAVPGLRDVLGPVRLWQLARTVNEVGQEATRREREACLSAFWPSLACALADLPTVWTAAGEWCEPRRTVIIERAEEEDVVDVLAQLGVPLVDPSLRPFHNLLRSGDIGVRLLDVQDITERVTATGMQSPCSPETIPEVLRTPGIVSALWGELGLLLQRSRREEDRRRVRELVATCPIVPCRDGWWRAAEETYVASEDAVTLCDHLELEVPIAWVDQEVMPKVAEHAGHLDTPSILEELEAALEDEPPLILSADGAHALLEWLDERRSSWTADMVTRDSIAALPIFPSAAGLRALTELVLPGDFEDPLGLTELVDLTALDGRRELLRALGAAELTLREYAIRHVPRAFGEVCLSNDERRRVVQLLVERFGELQDDVRVVSALQRVALVECADGEWRRPGDVYIPSELVQAVLGGDAPVAVIPAIAGALRTFLLTLGVAERPRVEDVLQRIESGVADPTSPSDRAAAGDMLRFLAQAWKAEQIDEEDLRRVSTRAWLPARRDLSRWYRPAELHATFREAIFAKAATFLDVPLQAQQETTDLLRRLGVRLSPTATQVVTHLLHSARDGEPVSQGVYEFLSREIADADVRALEPLKSAPFIMVPGGGYLTARQVFWSGHPFGAWRFTLGSDLRPLQRLFDVVGVRESPEWQDALAVLTELSGEFGRTHRALTAEARTVATACWRILSEALETDRDGAKEALAELSDLPVVPSRRELLEPPKYLLFEDRTDFARRFPLLQTVTISRPEGAWPAMAVAGVRSLAQVVRVELLESDGVREDVELRRRVAERRHTLIRVFASEKAWGGLARSEVHGLWNDVWYGLADRVVVQYAVDLFGRPLVSAPESPLAVYLPDEQRLLRAAAHGERAWAAVARELARAVDREGQHAGTLAGCIRDVLASASLEEAEATLDDLGYPAVDEVGSAPTPTTSIEVLGTHSSVGANETATPEAGEGRMNGGDGDALRPIAEPTGGLTTPEANRTDSSGAGAPAGPDADQGAEAGNGRRTRGSKDGGQSGHARHTQLRSGRSQSRLRSYVSTGGDVAGDSAGDSAARNALDRAGMDAVLDFERSQGRDPEEMPHAHPGYDIESRGTDGEVVRYIEVKSTGEPWLDRGVALSNVQFERARALGPAYWLYVVVQPGGEASEMIRIQDPARRIAQYIFDGGWRVAAEGNGN